MKGECPLPWEWLQYLAFGGGPLVLWHSQLAFEERIFGLDKSAVLGVFVSAAQRRLCLCLESACMGCGRLVEIKIICSVSQVIRNFPIR